MPVNNHYWARLASNWWSNWLNLAPKYRVLLLGFYSILSQFYLLFYLNDNSCLDIELKPVKVFFLCFKLEQTKF